MSERPIYLDHNATTPVSPQVLAAMEPYFCQRFGNPSSRGHTYGLEAEVAVQQSRQEIAAAIGARPSEIVFTSGATEANNLAIKGIAEAYMAHGRHIVTVQTEHSAVLEPCRYLEKLGFEVTYLPVDAQGQLDLGELAAALRDDTLLVSVMTANNETGVLQPIEDIGQLCRDRTILFHTDAAQALGKIPLSVEHLPIDLMSMTAHKLYGPKGIGALYIRGQVRIAPQMHGGSQERGLRSGTLYPPQIVGFSKAVEIALADCDAETARLKGLRDRLWHQLHTLPGIYLNGHPTERLAHTLSVSIDEVEGNTLLSALRPQIALSSGSACSTDSPKPSHVMTAMGRSDALARATLRFGLGRATTEADIDRAATLCKDVISQLRHSP